MGWGASGWVAGNDLVWGVMLAVLRIATYLVSGVHLFPFVSNSRDALHFHMLS